MARGCFYDLVWCFLWGRSRCGVVQSPVYTYFPNSALQNQNSKISTRFGWTPWLLLLFISPISSLVARVKLCGNGRKFNALRHRVYRSSRSQKRGASFRLIFPVPPYFVRIRHNWRSTEFLPFRARLVIPVARAPEELRDWRFFSNICINKLWRVRWWRCGGEKIRFLWPARTAIAPPNRRRHLTSGARAFRFFAKQPRRKRRRWLIQRAESSAYQHQRWQGWNQWRKWKFWWWLWWW